MGRSGVGRGWKQRCRACGHCSVRIGLIRTHRPDGTDSLSAQPPAQIGARRSVVLGMEVVAQEDARLLEHAGQEAAAIELEQQAGHVPRYSSAMAAS